MADFRERLQAEHDRLSAIMRADGVEKAGTPEYRKVVETHRLLTDLIAANGGTPEMQAEVARRLKEIAER